MRPPKRIGTFIAIAAKSTKIVTVLKAAKFAKVFVTATTMLLSTLAYGVAYGPTFAIGLTAMLFVHEMGHVIALRRRGFGTTLPVFVPFLGAAIFVKDFGNRMDEAVIGYGGPLLGTMGALACLAAWAATGSQLMLLVGFVGIYLNLFNMIPIRPLDGGRIGQVFGRRSRYFGIAALVALTIFLREPALLIIWVLVLQDFRMPAWWRPMLGSVLVIAMATLMWLGYSHQPFWVDCFDMVIAIGFTVIFTLGDVFRAEHGRDPFANESDARPYPALRWRWLWAAVYLGSVAGLWAVMTYLIGQMPGES